MGSAHQDTTTKNLLNELEALCQLRDSKLAQNIWDDELDTEIYDVCEELDNRGVEY